MPVLKVLVTGPTFRRVLVHYEESAVPNVALLATHIAEECGFDPEEQTKFKLTMDGFELTPSFPSEAIDTTAIYQLDVIAAPQRNFPLPAPYHQPFNKQTVKPKESQVSNLPRESVSSDRSDSSDLPIAKKRVKKSLSPNKEQGSKQLHTQSNQPRKLHQNQHKTVERTIQSKIPLGSNAQKEITANLPKKIISKQPAQVKRREPSSSSSESSTPHKKNQPIKSQTVITKPSVSSTGLTNVKTNSKGLSETIKPLAAPAKKTVIPPKVVRKMQVDTSSQSSDSSSDSQVKKQTTKTINKPVAAVKPSQSLAGVDSKLVDTVPNQNSLNKSSAETSAKGASNSLVSRGFNLKLMPAAFYNGGKNRQLVDNPNANRDNRSNRPKDHSNEQKGGHISGNTIGENKAGESNSSYNTHIQSQWHHMSGQLVSRLGRQCLSGGNKIRFRTSQLDEVKFIPKLSDWIEAEVVSYDLESGRVNVSGVKYSDGRYQKQQSLLLSAMNQLDVHTLTLNSTQKTIIFDSVKTSVLPSKSVLPQPSANPPNIVIPPSTNPSNSSNPSNPTIQPISTTNSAPQNVSQFVCGQISYYFSPKNYQTDIFMKLHANQDQEKCIKQQGEEFQGKRKYRNNQDYQQYQYYQYYKYNIFYTFLNILLNSNPFKPIDLLQPQTYHSIKKFVSCQGRLRQMLLNEDDKYADRPYQVNDRGVRRKGVMESEGKINKVV